MEDIEKQDIQKLVAAFVYKHESQAKAAKMLKVSDATLIAIKKGDWDLISDQMWRSIGKQVGLSKREEWNIIETQGFLEIQNILNDAQETSSMFAFSAQEGGGKDTAVKYYRSQNRNVYVVNCSEYFNKKTFLSRILGAMGKDTTGNISELMNRIIEEALKQELPIIIFNEADKLSDAILHFLITLYNEMEDRCAIILAATSYLSKRIQRGRDLRRKGYAELYSRCGRRIIEIEPTSFEEVQAICEANGIDNPEFIHRINNEYQGDLRRLSRIVFGIKSATNKKSKKASLKVVANATILTVK